MIQQTQQPTLSEALTAAMVAAYTTIPSAVLIATPHVHLYTAITGFITPQSTPSQFTEATFPGYAAATVTLTGPLNFTNSAGLGLGGSVNFIANSSIVAPGQNILGYWVDNGTTTFYAGEQFSSPVQIVNPFDYLDLLVIIGAVYRPLVA